MRKAAGLGWVLLLCCLWVTAAGAQERKPFPIFRGKDLTGASVSSEAFRGSPWLVAIGFDPTHGREMERWAEAFQKRFPEGSGPQFYTVAAISSRLIAFRSRMDRDLARDKPEAARRRIMTVYAADSVCRELRIRDRKKVHVYALDAAGNILAFEAGPFTDAAFQRLAQAMSTAQGASAPAP